MPVSQPHHNHWQRGTRFVLLAFACIGGTSRGWSGPLNFAGMFNQKLGVMGQTLRAGEWETYVTGYAWHLPYKYQQATRERLNETTWGGGIGRTLTDDDGDRHSVYFKAFADSHRDLQFNLGYAWQRYWRVTPNLALGGGYLAFLFLRQDVANYCPIPAVLPCASIRYRDLELVGLFVPRVSSDIKGDVLFFYLRVPLGSKRVMRDERTRR